MANNEITRRRFLGGTASAFGAAFLGTLEKSHILPPLPHHNSITPKTDLNIAPPFVNAGENDQSNNELLSTPEEISNALGFGVEVKANPKTPYALMGIHKNQAASLVEALQGRIKGKTVVIEIGPQITDAAVFLPVDNGLRYEGETSETQVIAIKVITDDDAKVNRKGNDVTVLQGYVERRIGQIIVNQLVNDPTGKTVARPVENDEPIFVFQHQTTS